MQAIILAAGMGKRLKNLTSDKTKCMVDVNGKTLIERAITQLNHFHLSKIILVVGYQSDSLIRFVGNIPSKAPIEFVENVDYGSTNNIYSLYLARDHLNDEDTILLESDLIFELDVLKNIIDDPEPNLALVAKYESWMDGTVVTIDEYNKIIDFLGKHQFKFCDAESYYKTVNIYKFSKEFSRSHYVPFLEAYCKALGNNEYYEQVLKVISILDNPNIKAKKLTNELWYEIDDAQDLDIASSLFADTAEEKMEKISSRFGGYWRYPKLLDYCYLVNPYYPPRQMMDEMKANFDRLISDYPSGQAVQALLAANYFGLANNQIVVGNGAAELIKALSHILPGKFGVIRPTFDEYPNRLQTSNIEEFFVPNSDYRYSSKTIIEYFSHHVVSNLIIINPDNPSGNYMEKAEMEKLIDWAFRQDVKLIVDESFIDFAITGFEETLIKPDILIENPHLIVVKSISKSFGVPGLRLGVACSSDKTLIQKLKNDIAIWNINSFAEFYLQIAEKYKHVYLSAMQEFKETRKQFVIQLQSTAFLRVLPSQANYVMCEVLPPYNAKTLSETLLEKHQILIKNLNGKKGIEKQFIRIAVKTDTENSILIKALQRIGN
jgi:histidinol-phosphate/aromatic aminotransferase/cobyric acid decarboxylase-like protein/choline kinase